MTENRRGEPRWRYLDYVFYSSPSASGEGHLANLSSGGIFVRADLLPANGECVQICIYRTKPVIDLRAEVRWVGLRLSRPQGFGARLLSMSAAYKELLFAVSKNRRAGSAPRMQTSVPVVIACGLSYDEGELRDISVTGARIEESSLPLEIGAQVTLTFALSLHERAFDIVSKVVRHTEQGGYAVEFIVIDPALKEALGRAAVSRP